MTDDYSLIIGNKKLEKYFSVKPITFFNAKNIKKNIYVLTDKETFPKKTFKNDLIEIIFAVATDDIIKNVEEEFKDIIKTQQEELNSLLWKKNYKYPHYKLSFIENFNNFDSYLKNINSEQANKALIKKAQDALSNTYKDIQNIVNNKISIKRQNLIENLHSKDLFDELIQALQVYIGNYTFIILDFMCNLAINTDKIPQNDVKNYIKFLKNQCLNEIYNGEKERHVFDFTPQGGIQPFMDFIKSQNETTYKNLKEYIEKTLSLALKPLTLTPSQLNDLFDNKNHTKKEKKHKTVIEDNTKNIFFNLPTSSANNVITEILSYKENINQLPIRKKQINHNSLYKVFKDDNKRRVTFKNDNAEIVIELENIEKIMGKKNPAMKFFVLSLIKANEQALHDGELEKDYVTFPLQELINIGFYKSIDGARRGFLKGTEALTSLKLKGKVRKAKNKEVMIHALEVLFTGAKVDRGQCYIYLNNRIDWSFITQYYSLIPKYYFSLSSRASELLYYIFFLARQNTKDIAENGCFNISFRAIQHRLLLPLENETKNPLRDIKEEIENAITEIEDAHFLDYGKDNKEVEFSLLQIYNENSSIEEYLNNGYLKIELKGDFAKKFIEINQDTIKQIETAKKRKNKAIEIAIEKKIIEKLKNYEKKNGE